VGLRRARLTACSLVVLGAAAWASGAVAVRYASSPSSAPCAALSPGNHVLHVDQRPPLLLHVPRGGATRPLPLLLALHGAGETGADFAHDTNFSRLADEQRFLVAYPSAGGPHAFWNMSGQVPGAPDHVQALSESLDDIEGAACVDRARVFATGVSHGTGDTVVPYGGRPPDYAGSVRRWLYQWRRIDGCHGLARRFTPQSGVHEIAWTRCAAGTVVAHVRLDRVSHGWPGGPATRTQNGRFAATWRTWQFFRSLPSRAPATGA